MRQDAKSVHNQWYYRLPGHHIKFTTYTYRLIRLRPKRRSIRCGCRINGNRSESNRRWGSHGITDSICFFQSDKTACCFWYPASAASSIFWVKLLFLFSAGGSVGTAAPKSFRNPLPVFRIKGRLVAQMFHTLWALIVCSPSCSCY